MISPLLRRKLATVLNELSETRDLSFELSIFTRPFEDIGVFVFVLGLGSHGDGEGSGEVEVELLLGMGRGKVSEEMGEG